MNKTNHDPLALSVARALHRQERPQATILFGSRARGDYEESRSDIDIMLILAEEPGQEHKEFSEAWAAEQARSAYGYNVPVQLVWLAREAFDRNRKYVNHVVRRALQDGVVMSQNPEDFSRGYDGNEETVYEREWTDYSNRLFHAERHLAGFRLMDDNQMGDLLIAQQAQSALEHALKAIIAGHGDFYRDTHNIGHLLGTVRRIDPTLADFSLSISPDIYSEYAGRHEYNEGGKEPLLTEQEGYRERTMRDVETLLERARRLGPSLFC